MVKILTLTMVNWWKFIIETITESQLLPWLKMKRSSILLWWKNNYNLGSKFDHAHRENLGKSVAMVNSFDRLLWGKYQGVPVMEKILGHPNFPPPPLLLY